MWCRLIGRILIALCVIRVQTVTWNVAEITVEVTWQMMCTIHLVCIDSSHIMLPYQLRWYDLVPAWFSSSCTVIFPDCIFKFFLQYQTPTTTKTSCAGGRHNKISPAPCKLTFDLQSGIRVTCDVGYLCVTFSLPRPLCSRLRPDVHDRQTDVRRASSLNAPYPRGWGIIIYWSLIKH